MIDLLVSGDQYSRLIATPLAIKKHRNKVGHRIGHWRGSNSQNIHADGRNSKAGLKNVDLRRSQTRNQFPFTGAELWAFKSSPETKTTFQMVGMTNQRYYTVPNKMVKRGVDGAHAGLLNCSAVLEEGGRPEIQFFRVKPPSGVLLCSPSFNSAGALLTTKFWSKKWIIEGEVKKRWLHERWSFARANDEGLTLETSVLLSSYSSNVNLISSLIRNFPPTISLDSKPFQRFCVFF